MEGKSRIKTTTKGKRNYSSGQLSISTMMHQSIDHMKSLNSSHKGNSLEVSCKNLKATKPSTGNNNPINRYECIYQNKPMTATQVMPSFKNELVMDYKLDQKLKNSRNTVSYDKIRNNIKVALKNRLTLK